jgi:hypothetical protein
MWASKPGLGCPKYHFHYLGVNPILALHVHQLDLPEGDIKPRCQISDLSRFKLHPGGFEILFTSILHHQTRRQKNKV